MKQEEILLSTKDGHSIFLRSWKPSRKKIKAVIQISHGMAEHSERYTATAQQLCDAGFMVFAHDHRGHGHSINNAIAGSYGKKGGWNLVKSDLNQVHQYIAESTPNIPLFLLGHSMGSFISMSYLIDYHPNLAGVILSGSNYDKSIKYKALKPIIKAEKVRLGSEGKSKLIEHLTFGHYSKDIDSPSTTFDWLSRDPIEVKKYIEDELCGFFCTNQLWDDLTDGLIDISSTKRLKEIEANLPIYLFAGAKDPVGEQGKGVRRLVHQLIGSGHTDVTYRLYPDGRHEMLNETNKEDVVRDLTDWLMTKIRHLNIS